MSRGVVFGGWIVAECLVVQRTAAVQQTAAGQQTVVVAVAGGRSDAHTPPRECERWAARSAG